MLEEPIKQIIANVQSTRERVIEDIQRVATKIDQSRGYSLIAYLRNSGCYSISTLKKFGTWRMLCHEAGFKCSRKGTIYRIVQRLMSPPVRREIPALPVEQKPKEIKEKAREIRKPVMRKVDVQPPVIKPIIKLPVKRAIQIEETIDISEIEDCATLVNVGQSDPLEEIESQRRELPCRESDPHGKGEIIADIREIAMQIGLCSPSLLRWDLYRQHGGQYRFDDVLQHGGFETLRKQAA